MNPIEVLWAILSRRVSARGPTDVASLQRFVEEEWAAIDAATIDALIDAWPERLAVVVANEGRCPPGRYGRVHLSA